MYINALITLHRVASSMFSGLKSRGERGQSTAEYALLLLGVATIALIVVTWASSTGKIAELFDAVVDSIIGRV
ncbi:MAG: hypothetical protein R8J94_07885 [Acidimicrobiia bacterium]|nr:hypothetical protein [Acidimicrobiia bacterium]